MGIMNLLKADWTGKVGQTVGAKWKNKSTIRSYTPPSNPNTPAQQVIRAGFKALTSYTALFTDQLKSLSALPTKSMSVRNAILHINSEQIAAGALDPATLKISRGGLPNVTNFEPTAPAGLASLVATWDKSTAATISAKARVVVVFVDQSNMFAVVGSALNTEETLTITTPVPASATLNVYYYVVDYRGSSRVGSVSAFDTVTTPAS
jgi:hypothetical protein